MSGLFVALDSGRQRIPNRTHPQQGSRDCQAGSAFLHTRDAGLSTVLNRGNLKSARNHSIESPSRMVHCWRSGPPLVHRDLLVDRNIVLWQSKKHWELTEGSLQRQ